MANRMVNFNAGPAALPTEVLETGVKIIVDNPKEVGADLVASAAAVLAHYDDNAIVVDMGTATTFTYIEHKVIKGVAIMGSVEVKRKEVKKPGKQNGRRGRRRSRE